MRFRHNKTGNIYRHLAYAIDCTNSRDGTEVVVYCRDDDEHDIFVREFKEFEKKFTLITSDPIPRARDGATPNLHHKKPMPEK